MHILYHIVSISYSIVTVVSALMYLHQSKLLRYMRGLRFAILLQLFHAAKTLHTISQFQWIGCNTSFTFLFGCTVVEWWSMCHVWNFSAKRFFLFSLPWKGGILGDTWKSIPRSTLGYMGSGDLYLHFVAEWARRGALVLCPDLPGHGRSDGMLTYIPDWWVRRDQGICQ